MGTDSSLLKKYGGNYGIILGCILSKVIAKQVRWTIAWQDSLLSFSFDRPLVTTLVGYVVPLSETALTEGFSYTEAMYHVCRMVQRIVNKPHSPIVDYSDILRDVAEVDDFSRRTCHDSRTSRNVEQFRNVRNILLYDFTLHFLLPRCLDQRSVVNVQKPNKSRK
jgi:hypothetical protein